MVDVCHFMIVFIHITMYINRYMIIKYHTMIIVKHKMVDIGHYLV